MQEYGGGSIPSKGGDYRDREGTEHDRHRQEGYQATHYLMQKAYGSDGISNKDMSDPNLATYCRVATGIYEATASDQQYQNQRYSAPSFNSPPNYGPGMMGESDRRQSWSTSNQEPIGTGAKKKILKSQDKRHYNADPRYHDSYKVSSSEGERQRRNLTSESSSSLDFFAEGEKMVSELCNITDNSRNDPCQKQNSTNQEDKNKASGPSDMLLTALDKIVIHDQIPIQIVQLAIEACTDAENIAIAHHNRPCFKNIHSICAKTRSNVQKPDSAVANLHSQGIPWVIKNFIFSFVRILDGWKGVKELLSEKHDTFSRIENKYYSPNIRECFVQWQAVTKEMLTHIYKTFKCLDHGFTMEQKSFTQNYYAANSAPPRYQQHNKFHSGKPHASTSRPVSASPPFNATQPPWMQNQPQSTSRTNDGPWPPRTSVTYKKYPVVPPPNPQNFYPLNDPDIDNFQKSQYKCDPCSTREAKPRQSWAITNISDFRALEGMCYADQRELYAHLKHKMDAEHGKTSGQPVVENMPRDLMQRRDMELKAKMIPLSHVEKSLIPSMAGTDMRSCYMAKNNSCGDTKEEPDFFAAWGQMVRKEPSDFITHHTHNMQVSTNVVALANSMSDPVQYIDPENDEFHEISKVYMKPGSYKVPIKPADPMPPLPQGPQEVFESSVAETVTSTKLSFPAAAVTLAPQPKYSMESWPCLFSRHTEDIFEKELKIIPRHTIPCMDLRAAESLEILTAMTSDNTWEAAKQSAPKLMDFIHEGSKADTARLYDALGLAKDEFSDDLKQKICMEQNCWPSGLPSTHFIVSEMANLWDKQTTKDKSLFTEVTKLPDLQQINVESDDQLEIHSSKTEDCKENTRCPSFDRTGNCVRDDNPKKNSSKSKVAGVWYHPKKKKPLPVATVKKFETVLCNLSQLKEASFVQHDMDYKVAPRFYEVVKYPMCLHDISTKLKNSSYTDYEQVVQDFRSIFNNVRLYLKTYTDPVMKKNVYKISHEFENFLNDEFQNKSGTESTQDDSQETNKKDDKEYVNKTEANNIESTKKERPSKDDKK